MAAWNHRTGQPHGVTHATLRTDCGGPAAAMATAAQLQARIDRIRAWAARAIVYLVTRMRLRAEG